MTSGPSCFKADAPRAGGLDPSLGRLVAHPAVRGASVARTRAGDQRLLALPSVEFGGARAGRSQLGHFELRRGERQSGSTANEPGAISTKYSPPPADTSRGNPGGNVTSPDAAAFRSKSSIATSAASPVNSLRSPALSVIA